MPTPGFKEVQGYLQKSFISLQEFGGSEDVA